MTACGREYEIVGARDRVLSTVMLDHLQHMRAKMNEAPARGRFGRGDFQPARFQSPIDLSFGPSARAPVPANRD